MTAENQFKPKSATPEIATLVKEQPNLIAELENKTNSQIAAELSVLEVEARKIDLEHKKQEIKYREQEMKRNETRAKIDEHDWAKIESAYNAAKEAARAKTLATLQFLAQRKANQDRCNHRKGGRGPDAVMRGIGDDSNRSVIFHKLPAGGTMVLCQRCGKEWHPANKWNTENGKLAPIPATPGWDEAIQFNTDNSPSGSSTFLFERAEV